MISAWFVVISARFDVISPGFCLYHPGQNTDIQTDISLVYDNKELLDFSELNTKNYPATKSISGEAEGRIPILILLLDNFGIQ